VLLKKFYRTTHPETGRKTKPGHTVIRRVSRYYYINTINNTCHKRFRETLETIPKPSYETPKTG